VESLWKSVPGTNKDEYLLRPDLGRQLNDASRIEVASSA